MSNELQKNEFRCEHCKGVFEKGWTDEEAKAEFKENFGSEVNNEDGVVCDDCYKMMMGEINDNRPPDWMNKMMDSFGTIGRVGSEVYTNEEGIVCIRILSVEEILDWSEKIKQGEILPANIDIRSINLNHEQPNTER